MKVSRKLLLKLHRMAMRERVQPAGGAYKFVMGKRILTGAELNSLYRQHCRLNKATKEDEDK